MSVWVYQVVLWCARPLVKLRLARRARREPAYAERVAERFGQVPEHVQQGSIWFHTVSAGETLAAVSLITTLKQAYPDLPFLVTTMTPTGSEQVRQRLGDQVDHCYAPYDFSDAVRAFYQRVQPRLLVLMETELWPNLIDVAYRRDVPVLLINARLSERSARGYQRVGKLTQSMLSQLDHVACQTAAHRDRFIGLGLAHDRVTVSGSIKYDLTLDADTLTLCQTLRTRFGIAADAPVWIAASTHPGEDELVLAAHRQLRERVPGLRLILVPRHPVRTDDVLAMIENRWPVARYTTPGAADTAAEIILGDEMGTLLPLYGLAQVAFVGGSLVDVGGHNPVEPGLFRLPMVAGPFQHNFVEAMQVLNQAGALRTVTDTGDLERAVADWLLNAEARHNAGVQALAVVDANRGAGAKLEALVKSRIERSLAQPATGAATAALG
ncbi:MAG: lipid IV(A) 3-deoxy-D-manno-octulosonic acid transferase [Pseudomonadota bacterium]